MKKQLMAAIGAVIFAGAQFASAQTSTWKIDPAHSDVEFGVRHMGLSTVRGTFRKINGTVTTDEKDITKTTVDATIDTSTVDTGEPQRDGHLKSPDFFDVAKYPTATFVGKKVSNSNGKLQLAGDLTLHGVTKPVTLDLDGPSSPVTGPDGKQHRAFSGTTIINRQDYGLNWQKALPTGEAMVADNVKLTIDIELVKQ